MKDDLSQEIHGRKMKDDLSQEIHGQKMKDDLSQEIHIYKCYKYDITPLPKKLHAKNFVKVTRIGEIMGRKIPPTLRKLSFKFRY